MRVSDDALDRIETGVGTRTDLRDAVNEIYALRFDLREADEKLARARKYIEDLYLLRDAG